MTKKDPTYNFNTWLTGLKAGDRVKIGACSPRSGCTCETYAVVGEVELPEPCVVIDYHCAMRYFSRSNGREIGARKNTYKNDSIAPYTDEDQAHDLETKEAEAFKQRKIKLIAEMNVKLGDGTLPEFSAVYLTNNQGMPLSKMERLNELLDELPTTWPLHPREQPKQK